MRRPTGRVALPAVVAGAVLLSGGAAAAVWTATADGPAASRADVLPTAAAPVATVSGSTVTLAFAASTTAGGRAVPRYDLVRYASGGTAPLATTTCTASPCTVTGVPDGSWQWTSTARYGTNWVGPASARSAVVVVAAAPAPTITAPTAGQLVGPAPELRGTATTAPADGTTVVLRLYAGASATGTPAQTLTVTAAGGAWSATPAPLAAGTWTLTASQTGTTGLTGTATRTFTVDATAPGPVVTGPTGTTAGTTTVTGTATTAPGDLATVTVLLYAGATATGTPAQTLTATASAGAWSAPVSGLATGSWTAVARQADSAGNTGTSAPRTWTVDATPPPVTLDPAGLAGSLGRPSFTGRGGSAATDLPTVTVLVYAGSDTTAAPVRTLTATVSGGAWSTGVVGQKLPAGNYTVIARQSDSVGNTGTATITFTTLV